MKTIASKIAKGYLKHQASKIVDFSAFREAINNSNNGLKTVKKAKDLVDQECDVQFAIYTEAQNLLSLLMEQISSLPELQKLNKKFDNLTDEFMPSWPPMSPVSKSFWVFWSLFDLKIGLDKESYFSIIYDFSKVINLNPTMIQFWGFMDQSRLGIYKVLRQIKDKVLLEEIFTKKEYICYTPNKHPINSGELWLIRLLPQVHENCDYQLICTSPYVLMESQENWIEFFDRNIMGIRGTQNCEQNYERFMKNGLNELYWLEFIFQAYGKHTDLVIYLYGIPDIASSRPHVSNNGRLPERKVMK